MEGISSKYQWLSKGLGSVGLIIGILTLLFSFIPIFGMLAIFLGIIALIICGAGIGIALKHKHPKSRLVTTLIITGIGVGISLIQFSAFG